MPAWTLDTTLEPLSIVALDDPRGREAADIETLVHVLEELKRRSNAHRLFIVLDLTGSNPDAARRGRIVTWLREEGWSIRHRVGALAIVAPSAFLRGAFTAVRWFFAERVLDSEIFNDRRTALDWLRARAARPA